jgi:mRNA-degrading endonuclease RelE of RelBE toxin-antitoxin system
MSDEQNLEIYEIFPTDEFNNNMKFYIKKRKFKNIHKDIKDILIKIKQGDFQGKKINDLDSKDDVYVYKARAKNSNTNTGKSNGYRLIYYVKNKDKLVILLTIYYKKDDNNIPTKQEIRNIIKKYI